jgi:hypothetical protein
MVNGGPMLYTYQWIEIHRPFLMAHMARLTDIERQLDIGFPFKLIHKPFGRMEYRHELYKNYFHIKGIQNFISYHAHGSFLSEEDGDILDNIRKQFVVEPC